MGVQGSRSSEASIFWMREENGENPVATALPGESDATCQGFEGFPEFHQMKRRGGSIEAAAWARVLMNGGVTGQPSRCTVAARAHQPRGCDIE